MICRSCIRAASRARLNGPSIQTTRFLSSTSSLYNTPIPAAAAPPASQAHPVPGAPSKSIPTPAAQPLSDSLTPAAPKGAGKPVDVKPKKVLVKSSVPAGTPLKGLNFLKNASDPVAMEDSEYPDWLWSVLDKQEKKAEKGAAGDLFSKSKKQRRLAAKRLRKEQLANPDLLVPKIPIYEQTIDLPAGDGSLQGAMAAAGARAELTKALRNKRRAGIKEANFLTSMK